MGRYAEGTSVPVSRSRDEVYRLLERYEADQAFASYLMLPDGSVAGDHITASVDRAYASGQMPDSILPGLPPAPKVIALGEGRSR